MGLVKNKASSEEQFAALVAQLDKQELAAVLADMRAIVAENSPPLTFSPRLNTVVLNSGFAGVGMA